MPRGRHLIQTQRRGKVGILSEPIDRFEVSLARTQQRDIAREDRRVRHGITAQWRYRLGSNGQIGAFIQRHSNESKPRVGSEIRLGFADDESSQLVTR